jgi:hypothetical protein
MLLALFLCLAPPLVVGLHGVGLPVPVGVAATLLVAGLIAWRRRDLLAVPWSRAARHPLAGFVWAVAFALTVIQVGRLSVYMNDVERPQFSVDPGDPFRVEHCCLTAYAESARMAAEGRPDVYDGNLYRPGGTPRRIGPLTVDMYHYPPPFLLLPGAVRLVATDFFEFRRVWFAMQALVLVAGVLLLARWIGAETGRNVALAAALLGAYPQTAWALQMGNFQITAIPVAVLGLAWATARPFPGAAMLAWATGAKMFPAMLVVHVVAMRRWKLVAWIAGAGLAIAALTAAVYGPDLFVQFIRDEMPQLADGSAFPMTEKLRSIPVNFSVYGLAKKLSLLGVDTFDVPTAKRFAQLYALLLAGLAAWAGFAIRALAPPPAGPGRLRLAAMWLGIVNLASFAGPFVGGGYGIVGSAWLLSLLVAGGTTPARRWGWLAVAIPVAGHVLLIPSSGMAVDPTPAVLWISVLGQVATIAINVWAVVSGVRQLTGTPR